MFYVYIIYSDKLNKYYTGSCDQLDTRLEDHNSGRSTYTKSGKPWVLKKRSHTPRSLLISYIGL
ncbi:GIY-YIG nuclease family protein [Roseivirga pacifica]|uniref:GIY-YIG nuclease family protein n=1 Tax=Roseivirga pacifica TaxID=1267423 RepID=UPI003B8A64D2